MLTRKSDNVADSQRTYRSTNKTVAALIALIIFDLIALSAITADSAGTVLVSLGVLYIAIATPVFGRLAWAGISTGDSGVRVANILSSTSFRWEDIERFAIERWKLLPGTCVLHLCDGRRKPAFGVQESANVPNGAAGKMVNELNRELAKHHHSVSTR